MSLPSRLCAAALLAAALGGCNALGSALGSGSSVMPESEIGPPPSMRGTIKTAPQRTAAVDDDGNPYPATPTRQLDLPKTVKGEARSVDAGPRRINRDDLEGADAGGRRSGGGGMSPAMTPGGGVGLGGKF